MEWNVYRYNFNHNKIEIYNIFEHNNFRESVELLLKKSSTKEEFAGKLNQEVLYYFWSKAECEILVSGWPPTKDKKEQIKIDIYQQICSNWQHFLDYTWNCKKVSTCQP